MDTCYPNNPNNRGDDSFADRVRATSIQKSKRLFRGLASATGAPYPVFLFRADQHRHFPRISSRHWQAPPLLNTVAYVSYLTMGMTFTHLFRETTRFTANGASLWYTDTRQASNDQQFPKRSKLKRHFDSLSRRRVRSSRPIVPFLRRLPRTKTEPLESQTMRAGCARDERNLNGTKRK